MIAALIVAATVGCRPSPSDFYSRVYACDKTVAGAECGTNVAGEKMMCFAARQLGAADFCADPCDGDVAASSTDTQACLESKALLDKCSPDAELQGQTVCREPLHCYRTNLLVDEGVCTTFDLCSPDQPCTDPARTTCASTVLRALYPHAALQLSNLYCVQLNCHHDNAACTSTEVCLPNVLSASSRPFDLCVPKCDSTGTCPPNFFCLQKTSSPANPAVCIPGLLGFRCVTNNDCMLGECIATGEGFNVCAVQCSGDDECLQLRGQRGVFKCLPPVPGSPSYCMAPESFSGAGCGKDSDCGKGEKCSLFSPFNTMADLGSCFLPCEPDGSCRPRGGVPHTCFNPPGVCYPGSFGLRCATDANCFGGNLCLPSNPKHAADSPKACTKTCERDTDCTGDLVSSTADAWCNEEDHTCVLGQGLGFPCTRSRQCASGTCLPPAADAGADASATGHCTARPGEAP